jgi:hypothetical protein
MNSTTSFVFASASLLFAACAGSDSRPLTSEEYEELAQSIGGVVATGRGGELGAVSDSLSIARGNLPLGFRVSGSGEIEGEHGALVYSYDVTCRDAAGDEQPACDATTDRADVTAAWSGQLELPRFRIETERDGAWTLSGLQGDTAVFAGTSDFRVAVDVEPLFGPAVRSYDLAYAAEYEDIEVDVAARRITGGSAHLAVTGELTQSGNGQDEEVAFDVDVVLSFDGDSTATLVIDGDHRFQIDLTSGRVTR